MESLCHLKTLEIIMIIKYIKKLPRIRFTAKTMLIAFEWQFGSLHLSPKRHASHFPTLIKCHVIGADDYSTRYLCVMRWKPLPLTILQGRSIPMNAVEPKIVHNNYFELLSLFARLNVYRGTLESRTRKMPTHLTADSIALRLKKKCSIACKKQFLVVLCGRHNKLKNTFSERKTHRAFRFYFI